MFKSLLAGVLLLNYLLVIVATNITTANAVKYTQAYRADKPYVHASDCQQRFYLQMDCFETCHDAEVVSAFAGLPLDAYLFLLGHGLDVHQIGLAFVQHLTRFAQVYLFRLIPDPALATGYAVVPCPPPNL
jgi:hypothetical protein